MATTTVPMPAVQDWQVLYKPVEYTLTKLSVIPATPPHAILPQETVSSGYAAMQHQVQANPDMREIVFEGVFRLWAWNFIVEGGWKAEPGLTLGERGRWQELMAAKEAFSQNAGEKQKEDVEDLLRSKKCARVDDNTFAIEPTTTSDHAPTNQDLARLELQLQEVCDDCSRSHQDFEPTAITGAHNCAKPQKPDHNRCEPSRGS
jgi:hypothetical protein